MTEGRPEDGFPMAIFFARRCQHQLLRHQLLRQLEFNALRV